MGPLPLVNGMNSAPFHPLTPFTLSHSPLLPFSTSGSGVAFYVTGYSNVIDGIQHFFSFFNQLDSQSTIPYTHLYVNEFLDGLVVTRNQPVIVQLPDSSSKFVGVVAVDLKSENTEFMANSFLVSPSTIFSL